ncbi:hypothetical protein JTB14_010205 [Gonioctena quinquepunctata]|nr:hypothetical protein JTB14_010205 [Gonioctena quinquepunctata]
MVLSNVHRIRILPNFDESVWQTNLCIPEGDRKNQHVYGGLDIEVSNIVFVHGATDPWKVLGITGNENDASPAILIEGAAHCANMYPSSESDSIQLQEARMQIEQLIGSWLEL